MDILTEIASLILESFFGWDESEITVLCRTYPGRHRSIVRRIGSSLPAILPRLFSKRSIIRDIGSFLPLPPVKRPHFQIGSSVQCSLEHANVQEDDINWIMGPEYNYDDTFSCEQSDGLLSVCDETVDIDIENICMNKQQIPTSTPTYTTEMIIHNDLAMKKISDLEDELNRLRIQIASLVVAPPCTPSIPAGPMTSCTPVTPFAPPPPPPPPPPPIPTLTPVKSVIDVIKENCSRRRTIPGLPSDKPGVPNMTDILKGLGTVRLKSIERSPGGTPVRNKPLETEATDPSSIIARALKKKFAQRRKLKDADSPSFDKENASSFSPSPAKSPTRPLFGRHLLKSSKERRKSASDHRVLQTSPLVNIKA